MNLFLSLLADAQQPASGGLFGLNQNVFLTIIMIGFIAFFYFVVVIPQNKKKKEMERMLSAIKKGDKVVSIGGIHGKVSTVKDNEIIIKIDSNAEVTLEKSAISRVLNGAANSNVKADAKNNNKNEETKK